jgi:hypothetical protein
MANKIESVVAQAEALIIAKMVQLPEANRSDTAIVVIDGRDAGARTFRDALAQGAAVTGGTTEAVPELPKNGCVVTGCHYAIAKAAASAAGYELEPRYDTPPPNGFRVIVFTDGGAAVLLMSAPGVTRGGSAWSCRCHRSMRTVGSPPMRGPENHSAWVS